MPTKTSKGNAQTSKGDVCNHSSPFIPKKTAKPIEISNWEPKLIYRRINCLLLSGCCLLFIITHLYYVSSHMALAIESCRGFYLQFAGIYVTVYHRLPP